MIQRIDRDGNIHVSGNYCRYSDVAALKTRLSVYESELKHVHNDLAYCQDLNANLLIERDELKSKLAELDKQEPVDYEAELSKLLPDSRYMDPPDGGSVTVLEQIKRMINHLKVSSTQPQHITEQELREILDHFHNQYNRPGYLQYVEYWVKNEGRTLLDKLNEHREPESVQDKKLSAPARVAARIFCVGDSESKVIEAAQRQFEANPPKIIPEDALCFANKGHDYGDDGSTISDAYFGSASEPVTANKAEVPPNQVMVPKQLLLQYRELIESSSRIRPLEKLVLVDGINDLLEPLPPLKDGAQ